MSPLPSPWFRSTSRYLRQPFQREPDFGVTSVNDDLAELLARGEARRHDESRRPAGLPRLVALQ